MLFVLTIVSKIANHTYPSGQLQFNEIRERILRLGIEMATSAQRDRFVENPVDQVKYRSVHVISLQIIDTINWKL